MIIFAADPAAVYGSGQAKIRAGRRARAQGEVRGEKFYGVYPVVARAVVRPELRRMN